MHDLATPDAGPGLIREWIDCAARLHPDKPYFASAEDGRGIMFGDFARLVRRIGRFLDRAGIGANDRIALLAGNSIEHVACYVGVMAYGATICTVHVEMNRRHLGGILAQLKPRLALCDDDLVLDDMPDGTPCLRLGRWDAPPHDTLFASIEESDPGGAHNSQTTPRHDGVILFTSGTTDRPKGVVLSYREQIGNVTPMADAFSLSAADRIYDFRSFNWASAQLFGVLGPLCRGATLVMRRKFSATRLFADIRAHGITVAAGTTMSIAISATTEPRGRAVAGGCAPATSAISTPTASCISPDARRTSSSAAASTFRRWRSTAS